MDEAENNIGHVKIVWMQGLAYVLTSVLKCISDEDLKWFKKCCVETRTVHIEAF
jgi:hypothetical protein